MKKLIALGIVVVVVVAVVLVLGYFGIIPGIGGIFGWDKPQDLGVTATAQDYTSGSQKLGRQRAELPASAPADVDFAFEGSHPVNASFTQEELTAQLQTRDFAGNPFSGRGQIRVNDDGTIEVSEAFNVNKLLEFIDDLGVLDSSTENLLSKASFIKGDVRMYFKGTVSAVNNAWDIDVQTIKLGPISIPVAQVPVSSLENTARSLVNSIAGLDVESFSVTNGKVSFQGTYPDTSYYRPAE